MYDKCKRGPEGPRPAGDTTLRSSAPGHDPRRLVPPSLGGEANGDPPLLPYLPVVCSPFRCSSTPSSSPRIRIPSRRLASGSACKPYWPALPRHALLGVLGHCSGGCPCGWCWFNAASLLAATLVDPSRFATRVGISGPVVKSCEGTTLPAWEVATSSSPSRVPLGERRLSLRPSVGVADNPLDLVPILSGHPVSSTPQLFD